MCLMCQCYAKLQFFVCSYSSLSWIGLQYVPDFSSVPAKSYKNPNSQESKRVQENGDGGGGGEGWKRVNVRHPQSSPHAFKGANVIG